MNAEDYNMAWWKAFLLTLALAALAGLALVGLERM